MTSIKQFLFEQIGQLSVQFPAVRFRYGFDNLGGSHIIEASPEEVFDGSLGDILWDLEIEAATEFPYDLVTFISESSCISLEEVEQEWVGETYKPILHTPTIANRSIVADVILLNTDAFSSLIQLALLGDYTADWNLSASETQFVSGPSVSLIQTKHAGNITVSPEATQETTRCANIQYAMAA